MDYNEVAIYLEVVQAGSFSKAAQRLGLPKSTVSHKVSSLEARLGVTLLRRTTRKLNVTAAGQAYFDRCLQGLEAVKAAEAEVSASQKEPRGHLRITAPTDLGSSLLPPLISDFSGKYPKISVEVLLTERRVDLLEEKVDLAIRAGELKDSSLKAKKIGSIYFAPFASPKYLKANGRPEHPKDLREHRCLQFAPMGGAEWKLIGPKSQVSVAAPGPLTLNDLNMLKAQALLGDGIVFLPTYLCYSDADAGKLVRLLPEWRSPLTPIHFVYPGQRFVSPALTAFMEMAFPELKKKFDVSEI